MKKLFNIIKNVLPKNIGANSETPSFFKDPLAVKDVERAERVFDYSKTKVEDNLKELEMVVLSGTNRKKVIVKIEEIIFRSNFSQIPEKIQDACEIVHYAVKNNEPVRLSHVKLLLPNIEVDTNDLIQENAFQDWVKSKSKIEPDTEYSIKIEDTYKMRNTSMGENSKSFNEMPNQDYHEEWKKREN